MSEPKPIRVAIVGGGCAGLTAAFELTRAEQRGKYEITIYQLGWRLGGKGASGRGPAFRIEEHGFHVWMGFYENAFKLMRECYAELNRDRTKFRIASWRDAFSPAPFIGLAERGGKPSLPPLIAYFPPAEGLPGDPLWEHDAFTIPAYLTRAANALRAMIIAASDLMQVPPRDREDSSRIRSPHFESYADAALESRIAKLLKFGGLISLAGLIEGAAILHQIFALRIRVRFLDGLVERLLETMASAARGRIGRFVTNNPDLRVLWQGIDLALTSMLGIIRYDLINDPQGFDAINEYDSREWLRMNGASEDTLNSALFCSLYDMVFAYENGDYNCPRQGAGVGLRGTMRLLFSYRGAMVWKMNAGMGDIVFAPLYEVLKRRGVSFQFFHRLENLRLADPCKLALGEPPYVAALEFDLQAEVIGGQEYQPLIDVDGLPCWPSKPDYDQLLNGPKMAREDWRFESHWDRRTVGTKTLRVIEDFDFVVLAIGGGGVKYVTREILHRDKRWRDMVEHMNTIETQSVQLWLNEDLEALGWDYPPVSLSGFIQPFESFADMRQLIREERWPRPPAAITYFLSTLKESVTGNVLNEHDYPERKRDQVRRNAINFLKNDIGKIFPKALTPDGHFRWELLMDPSEDPCSTNKKIGEARFDSQFWRANVNPTERYVISVPGSQKYRISPLDNSYDNLTIAGDWTACGMDSGCVEAAVMSGRLAAHALSSLPALEEIVAYDHP